MALVGIAFVWVRFRTYAVRWQELPSGFGLFLKLTLLAMGCGLAGVMLALAWRHLLAHLGVRVPRQWAIRIYGLSQISKYIPGNVFQFAGRQALGVAAGYPGAALAKSSLWEVGLITVIGSFFAVKALPLVWPAVPAGACGVAFLGLPWAGAVIVWRLFGRQAGLAWLCQFVYLALSCSIFIATMALVHSGHVAVRSWLLLAGAYGTAWLAGLVTPGAPAGIGVREWVLVFLLRGHVSESEVLWVALVGRAVTLGGDLLFYLGAHLVPARRPKGVSAEGHRSLEGAGSVPRSGGPGWKFLRVVVGARSRAR